MSTPAGYGSGAPRPWDETQPPTRRNPQPAQQPRPDYASSRPDYGPSRPEYATRAGRAPDPRPVSVWRIAAGVCLGLLMFMVVVFVLLIVASIGLQAAAPAVFDRLTDHLASTT